MKSKLKNLVIPVLAAVLGVTVITTAVTRTGSSKQAFATDGYVLEVDANVDGTSVTQLAFSSGTKYATQFPSTVKFKDISNETVTVKEKGYVHYSEGSISSFSDGVVIDMAEASNGYVDFYQLKSGMVLSNVPSGWEIDNNGKMIPFEELFWQLDTDTALVASDELTLVISGKEAEAFKEFAEVRWVDAGIVQVSSNDNAWQISSQGSYIKTKSGAMLDLGKKETLTKDGKTAFTMEDVDADAKTGILVSSTSNEEWIPPVFKFDVSDGEDGEAGESGEAGVNGEAGDNGEAGIAGEEGLSGENGAGGKTGQTGSSASSGGTSVNTNTLGQIRLTDFVLSNITSADFTLTVDDEDATLTKETGIVEIRDSKTNKIVWSSEFDATGNDVITFEDENAPHDVLAPDHEYVLIVKNGFSVDVNGVTNTGTKTFINRSFVTPSEGLIANVVYQTENVVNVAFEKSDYSTVRSYAVSVEIDGDVVTFGPKNYDDFNLSNNGMELDLEDLFTSFSDETGRIYDSNLPYTITVYSSEGDASAPFWTNDDDEIFVGIKTGNIRESSKKLSGITLKQKPELEEVKVTLNNAGYYELEAIVGSDPDNAITKYVFTITDEAGNVVNTYESGTGKANWYYGDALSAGTYTVSALLTYYDNEKTATIGPKQTMVTATSTGSIGVRFSEYKVVTKNGSKVFENEKGTTIDVYDKIEAVSATRIWGDIVIIPNGVSIDTNTSLNVKVSSNGESTYARDKWTLNLPTSVDENGNYYVPIKMLGLKADTVYSLAIYGTTITPVSNGSGVTNNIVQPNKYLGTVSIKTDKLASPGLSTTKSVAAFEIKSMVNDASNPEAVAGFKLYKGTTQFNGINSVSSSSEYYENRAIARAVEFQIYSSTNSLLGTVVKDLVDPTIFTQTGTGFENVNQSTTLEGKLLYGPLMKDSTNGTLAGSESNGYAIITKNDLINAGITVDSSKIQIYATAIYDYSYGLRNNISKYNDYFLSYNAVNYNRMPLNVLSLVSGGVTTGYLNYAVVDLGERAPYLINPADEAISVEVMYNGLNPVGYNDPTLANDTGIGFKVQSNFEAGGQETKVTYYCFTMDDWMAYKDYYNQNSGSILGIDLIQSYELGESFAVDSNWIKFKIEIDTSKYSGDTSKQLPALYVVIADPNNPDDLLKINACRTVTQITDDFGNTVSTITYKPYSYNSSKAIIYTDAISRGDCYVFANTVDTMYGVSTTTDVGANGDGPQAWVFPYSLDQYTSSRYFGTTGLQRSEGTPIYKEVPRVAAYLDYTNLETPSGSTVPSVNTAYWKYIVYDPDDTLMLAASKKGKTRPITYAGLSSSLLEILADEYLDGINAPTLLKSGLYVNSSNPYNRYTMDDLAADGVVPEDVRKTVLSTFGLTSGVKDIVTYESDGTEVTTGTLHTFTVKVEDGSLAFSSIQGRPYQIWLASLGFLGEYTTDEEVYKETRLTNNGVIDINDHFAVTSVSHVYDSMLALNNIDRIQARVSSVAGSDGLRLDFQPISSVALQQHLVGIYYEIYDASNWDTTYQSAEEALNAITQNRNNIKQYGFWEFVAGDSTLGQITIPITELTPDTPIFVSTKLVYDTGQAGLNLSRIASSTHAFSTSTHSVSASRSGLPQTATNQYAIQKQNSSSYATNTSYSNYGLIYNSTGYAYGSVYRVNTATADENYAKAYTAVTRTVNTNHNVAPLNINYSDRGGYTENQSGTDYPIFKGLKESSFVLISSTNTTAIQNDAGEYFVMMKVPTVIPNLTSESYTTSGLHETNFRVTFSEKSIQSMMTSQYSEEVYFELYTKEGDNEVLLENTENRFFDVYMNNETAYSNNKFDPSAYVPQVETDTSFTPPSDPNLIVRTNSDGTPVTSYNIYVGNLPDTNTNYYLRMYCLDSNGEKVYILNNITQATLGDRYTRTIRTANKVNIGSRPSAMDALEFKVDFTQKDYVSQLLEYEYSLNTIYGYYLEYSIVDAAEGDVNGNVTTVQDPDNPSGTISLDMNTLMRLLGYTNSEVKQHYYYQDNQWKYTTYTEYSRLNTNGTKVVFAPSYTISGNFSFNQVNKLLYSLEGDTSYRLMIKAYDLYGGSSTIGGNSPDSITGGGTRLEVTQDSNQPSPFPTGATALFTVPVREDIQVNAMVSYTDINSSNATANLSISVKDNGFKLGYMTGSNLVYGAYEFRLYKLNSSGNWTRITVPSSTVTISDPLTETNGVNHYVKDKSYTILYPVVQGERYRVQVYGVDLSTTGRTNTILYDSETDSDITLKDRLSVTDLSRPLLNNIVGEYDRTSENFAITTKHGSNLETINRISYTLYYMEGSSPVTATYTVANSFTSPNPNPKDIQTMTISLTSLIDEIEEETGNRMEQGDLLILTVQYQNNSTYLTQSTFNFLYR